MAGVNENVYNFDDHSPSRNLLMEYSSSWNLLVDYPNGIFF